MLLSLVLIQKLYIGCALGLLVFVAHALLGRVPLSYNVRNLSLRWKTTAMTALAFTLVMGLLTVMLAFVNGMYLLTISSGQPGNVMILADGSTDESFSSLGYSDIGDIENQAGILHEGEQPLVSRETYLNVNQPIENPRPGRPNRRFVQLRGVNDPVLAGRVHGLSLYDGGTWFSDAGVEEAGEGMSLIQVVLGEGVARVMAGDRTDEQRRSARNPDRLEVGDTFSLGGRQWIVKGLLKSAGSTFDSEVWAKQSLVGPMFGKTASSTLVARTAGPDEAQKLRDFLATEYKKSAVNAQVETKYFENLSATNTQFLYAIAVVAGVMAVGGMFGVMNTMFAAISQRRTDIGVLRLLGFTRGQVLLSFLMESMVIALIGGLIGIALGSLSHGWSTTSVVSGGGGGKSVVLKLVVDQTIIAATLAATLAMGFFGGFIPALSAMRFKPLDTLR
ncbi:MAG: ABC transporter permease [Planctomycetaceae bacterium]|nr:ABC transporter permease [Planctomycetaceae bacterium]